MAAYAALLSLMHIIDQIQHHPRPPISLDRIQVESLTKKVNFLQEFLEDYSPVAGCSKEAADDLESRIAAAVYAAEDVIESHIVDRILAASTNHGEKISSIEFYQDLQKVMEEMDFIKKEVMEIKEMMKVQDLLQGSPSFSTASLRSASMWQNNIMVGFDDILYEVMDKLTGDQLDRQIIPIVGMGGIGKTTLARNIFQNQVVVQHFDILVWVTISQEYRMREILLELLQEDGRNLRQMDDYGLGDKLHKKLSGRRYLIIMDDIWDIKVWDQLKFFFPDNNNGNRIILTTRLSKLAFHIADSHGIEMGFLDEDNSWDLFCKNVFGKEECPLEFEEIGKKIARNCRGLPLSIAVIGGLLAKSTRTQEYWEYTLENLNSIVNLEEDKRCLQILYTSYNSLPVYLKPCFLYMGVFPEDDKISVFELIKLWVAEGFLKPIHGKSSEEVAEEYLEELIDRNLVLVEECKSYEKISFCKIHDLLRDLCLREAQKQKFLCVLRVQSLNIPRDINTQRRICIHTNTPWEEYPPQLLDALESALLVRSLIWKFQESLPLFGFKLLRVSSAFNKGSNIDEVDSVGAVSPLVNLRYLDFGAEMISLTEFPSSVSLLWNLQTLTISN